MARTGGGQAAPGGLPLLAKIGDVRFRNPVYPGDTTTIEVKKKDTMGGFTMMSGSIRTGDKRVLTVEFAVAWKAPEAPAVP
jgi:3-hydroxyacyl-[acyl-carrier-protein] dehydratase